MSDHPDWCNKKHQAGANPRRQSHLRTWRSDHKKGLPLAAELYPGSQGMSMQLEVSGKGRNACYGNIHAYITADEARDLADTLYELAAACDAESQRLAKWRAEHPDED